jgi:hypothetical protein
MIFVCLCGFWSHLWNEGWGITYNMRWSLSLTACNATVGFRDDGANSWTSCASYNVNLQFRILLLHDNIYQCWETLSSLSSAHPPLFRVRMWVILFWNIEFEINLFSMNLTSLLCTCFHSDLLCPVQGARCQVYWTCYAWLILPTFSSALLSYTHSNIQFVHITKESW